MMNRTNLEKDEDILKHEDTKEISENYNDSYKLKSHRKREKSNKRSKHHAEFKYSKKKKSKKRKKEKRNTERSLTPNFSSHNESNISKKSFYIGIFKIYLYFKFQLI